MCIDRIFNLRYRRGFRGHLKIHIIDYAYVTTTGEMYSGRCTVTISSAYRAIRQIPCTTYNLLVISKLSGRFVAQCKYCIIPADASQRNRWRHGKSMVRGDRSEIKRVASKRTPRNKKTGASGHKERTKYDTSYGTRILRIEHLRNWKNIRRQFSGFCAHRTFAHF